MSRHPALERLGRGLDSRQPPVEADWPEAAVLAAIDVSESEPTIILTRRAGNLRLHAGEIAFPGGKCDEGDHDYWATALREAEEETALPPELIQPLGLVRPMITRTGIRVVPCVGVLAEAVELVPNPEELDRVFRAPLEFFAEAGHMQIDEFEYGGMTRRVPRYEYGEYSVWGITAAVLVRLANIAFEAGLELEDYWRGRTS